MPFVATSTDRPRICPPPRQDRDRNQSLLQWERSGCPLPSETAVWHPASPAGRCVPKLRKTEPLHCVPSKDWVIAPSLSCDWEESPPPNPDPAEEHGSIPLWYREPCLQSSLH